MKSLGKQDVLCISLVDGQETRRATERRAVYEDKQGQLWVNFRTGKRRIQREGDQLTWRLTATSIRVRTLPEILARLSNPKP